MDHLASARIWNGEQCLAMLDGMPADDVFASSFEGLHLDTPPPTSQTCDQALLDLLYCDEVLLSPLGLAHKTLVLPLWLREQAATLSDRDWAQLCEVGVAAAMPEVGEGERVHAFEDFEIPVLDLSAHDEGFIW